MQAHERLILPLDVPDLDAALPWIDSLGSEVGTFKVGLELFTAAGPAAVQAVHKVGARTFLDLKIHDIPATVGRSVAAATRMGVRFLTIHASMGKRAMQAAAEAATGTTTQLLAVTVLTSLDAKELQEIGFDGNPASVAKHFAQMATEAGINGFVCSAFECEALRSIVGPDATLVVPGVRPAGAQVGDQRRVATPTEAIQAGADHLVIGRPIRNAADPVQAAKAIAREIAAASGETP